MLEVTRSRPSLEIGQILCFYQNGTSQIQIIRLISTGPEPMEKVAFPGERLMFQAFPDAELQVYSTVANSPHLVNCIPCAHLQVNEQ